MKFRKQNMTAEVSPGDLVVPIDFFRMGSISGLMTYDYDVDSETCCICLEIYESDRWGGGRLDALIMTPKGKMGLVYVDLLRSA